MALRLLRRAAKTVRTAAKSKAAKKVAAKQKAAATSKTAKKAREVSTAKTNALKANQAKAKQREQAQQFGPKSPKKAPKQLKVKAKTQTTPGKLLKAKKTRSQALAQRKKNQESNKVALQRRKAKRQEERRTTSEETYKATETKGAKSPTPSKVVSRTTETLAKPKAAKKGIPFRSPTNKKPAQPKSSGRVIRDKRGRIKNSSPTGNKRQTPKGTNPSQKVSGSVEHTAREARRKAVEQYEVKAKKIMADRLRKEGSDMDWRQRRDLERKLKKQMTAGKKRVGDTADSKARSKFKGNLNQSPGVAYAGDSRNKAGFKNKVGNRDSSNRLTGSKMRKLSEDMSSRKARGELKPIKQSPKYKPSPSRQGDDLPARNMAESKKRVRRSSRRSN